MNKKQLIVAWVMGLLIIMLISDAPKMYYQILPSELGGGRWVDYKPKNFCTMTKIRWDTTFQSSLIILIIGGLLICTLRTKKE